MADYGKPLVNKSRDTMRQQVRKSERCIRKSHSL
jgi:hypothetical protein